MQNIIAILGDHPTTNWFGKGWLSNTDGATTSRVPHRALNETSKPSATRLENIRKLLRTHHASAEKIKRLQSLRKIFAQRGFPATAKNLRAFPQSDKTRKGNFAEAFLAEYLAASGKGQTLVYRLRFNPNVDQSMKGDDVLCFTLETNNCEIVVGEAKFRSIPTKDGVLQVVNALETSYRAGIPMSLQFVADRLFEENKTTLGRQVLDCSVQILKRKAVLTYAGLLMSGSSVASYVDKHCPATVPRSGFISVKIPGAPTLIAELFDKLEAAYGINPR